MKELFYFSLLYLFLHISKHSSRALYLVFHVIVIVLQVCNVYPVALDRTRRWTLLIWLWLWQEKQDTKSVLLKVWSVNCTERNILFAIPIYRNKNVPLSRISANCGISQGPLITDGRNSCKNGPGLLKDYLNPS